MVKYFQGSFCVFVMEVAINKFWLNHDAVPRTSFGQIDMIDVVMY
jgi:hypothetical protein